MPDSAHGHGALGRNCLPSQCHPAAPVPGPQPEDRCWGQTLRAGTTLLGPCANGRPSGHRARLADPEPPLGARRAGRAGAGATCAGPGTPCSSPEAAAIGVVALGQQLPQGPVHNDQRDAELAGLLGAPPLPPGRGLALGAGPRARGLRGGLTPDGPLCKVSECVSEDRPEGQAGHRLPTSLPDQEAAGQRSLGAGGRGAPPRGGAVGSLLHGSSAARQGGEAAEGRLSPACLPVGTLGLNKPLGLKPQFPHSPAGSVSPTNQSAGQGASAQQSRTAPAAGWRRGCPGLGCEPPGGQAGQG